MNTTFRRRRWSTLSVLALLSICALVFGIGRNAQAQSDGLTVTIVEVDDAAFPQVTVRFTVQDEDGLPATGLTTENLQVKEEGIAIPAPAITLEGDTTQPIGLVLAIDVSVELSVVRAMPGNPGRSISKRFSSSDEKCCESAAEPPLPHESILPPPRRQWVTICAAVASGSASRSAAICLVLMLSWKF